jgi:branched-chain amino acid transport system ATP-binding protein
VPDADGRDPFAGLAAEPGVAKPDPILVADGVRRSFGGLVAVDVDHLEVQRGSITALIGPNGAGKTTLFNVLTGFDRRASGRWRLCPADGAPIDLSGAPPHRVARLGMVRTFQLTRSLGRLTVLENLKLGATSQRGERLFAAPFRRTWRDAERQIEVRADALLERFRLSQLRDDFAGELSGGQRKLLEMARALMVGPALVMLDEPMAGVNPALTQSLLEHVKDLRRQGMTVMFVEHDMDVVHDISDWVVVMGEGRVIAEGTPDDVATNPVVIDAYLGTHHDAPRTVEEERSRLADDDAVLGQEGA